MQSVFLWVRLVICALCFLVVSSPAIAEQDYVRPRINGPVEEGQRIRLAGNTHPLARLQFDVEPAPPNLPMERMLLVLKRSPEQRAALLKLLEDQQDKSSATYHKWLTPEQFGREFGPADSDLQAVTSWLQSHGFQVEQASKGRTMIEFSGTAAQVQETLHTAIHKYNWNGESHWANANDPEIPAALAPVVAGVHSLHNFQSKPFVVVSDERFPIARHSGLVPHATGGNGAHALAPDDYATIYNINPIYRAGIDGTGITIAVVGRSGFNLQDVADFRGLLGLPSNLPQIVSDGPDPGNLGGNEEAEALLDVSWSGALARNATVKFVLSASTNSTDGIILSELYIIDNNLGDVMTESFGGCEAATSTAEAAGFEALAEEAAAQGITYMVSTGDTGAAGCDNLGETRANGPVSVSVLAATPFTVAVGGTMFNENGHDNTYWNNNNSGTLASAKSYIPENVWNETCTTQCSGQAPPLAATGGGASTFFSKPSWQSGVAGIPNDGARDVPDVSLTAANHDPYLLCFEGSCQSGSFLGVSGTSAAAPSFAGIMALIDQKTGSRQGAANYILYRLAAAENLSKCSGSKISGRPASSCVFNDVTVGNNGVPGEAGYGTHSVKYQSTVGYDLASGLGSVNVANLVNGWNSVAFRPTTTTLTLTPSTFTHGSMANVNVSVAPNSGEGTATGDVSLVTDSGSSIQGVTFFTLGGGTVSGTSNGLPGGTYKVRAHYSGDPIFAASDSAPVTVTVSPEGSNTTLSVFGFDSMGHLIPFSTQAYGSPVYFRSDVAGVSGNGVATGSVLFADNGADFSGNDLNSEGTAATAQGIFTIAAGSHSITAKYSGDAGLSPSSSAPVNISVTQASTDTTITSSSGNAITGGPVTLSATVNTVSGGLKPGGTVTFLSGGDPIVSPFNPSSLSGFNGSGSIQNGAFRPAQGFAVLNVPLPAGQHSITAQYSGDANYTGSASAATIVSVEADFVISAGVPSVTIASRGGSGTVILTVTGQTGYNGTINFAAASCSGLPRESTCNFSPASITGNASTKLTISTTAPRSARVGGPGWWTASLGVTLAGVLLLGAGTRRRVRNTLLSLITAALLIALASCGGAGGGNNSGRGGDSGTPAGTSTVTITATSGMLTHTVTLALNVQ